MPPAKRKSYTAAFKLEVLKYAKENGNRPTERKYGVSEKLVRDWRKKEDTLSSMKKTKRAMRGNKPRWQDLENEMEDLVTTQRDSCRGVSTVQIRMKAKEVAEKNGIADFQGGPSWALRFMRRKHLSLRTRTTVAQKLPADHEEQVTSFREFVSRKSQEFNFDADHVLNMDEVPLTFDIPMNRTVDNKGNKTVTIRTTGHEKTHFTVVLACAASGYKLPPMIIFKRKTQPKEKFPRSIVIECNAKGWMNCEVMASWITKCYQRRPDGFFHTKKAVLVLDSMRAHIAPDVKDAIKNQNTIPAVIPGGLTKVLQPLDIAVNRSFKAELRKLWEDWMCSGTHSFTATGRMRRATYGEVAQWVATAWERVPTSCITSGFRKAELFQYGNEEPAPMDVEDSDDEESTDDYRFDPTLFNSDTEDEEFDGFTASDVEGARSNE